jgi:hypothetical protein
MKVLVITQCTGSKAKQHERQLTLQDFKQGKDHVKRREEELADWMLPAKEMYTGPHHSCLMEGIKATTSSSKINVDLRILSAGYGLLCGDQSIAPYEATFSEMKRGDLREWAATLRVPEGFRKAVAVKFDLCIVLLGREYLEACSLDKTVKFGGTTIAFCGTAVAKRLENLGLDNLRVVKLSITKDDRSLNKDFSSTNTKLKGVLAARLLKCLAAEKVSLADLADRQFDLLALLARSG